jgi:phage recombination protein Bet
MEDIDMNSKDSKNEIAVRYKIGDEEIKLTPTIVQNYLVGTNAKITMPEFKLFTELCKVRKLNPFLREAYLIKYSDNNPASIVVGKDAIIKRAVLNQNFNGMESGVIVLDENGEVIERKGTFKLPNEQLVGAWAKVYRKDWEYPIYQSVSLQEAEQRKSNGQANSNWSKQPSTMLEKVAKVRALREAFVEDLGGMYSAEEMNVDISNEKEQVITGKEKVKEAVIIENEETGEVEASEEISFDELG